MSLCIRIIRPASREKTSLLPSRIQAMEARGHKVLFEDLPIDESWPFVASSYESRLKSLTSALLEPSLDVIIAARGGYGVSDLLDELPWDRLEKATPKVVVGYSDICALHSALFNRLGWKTCIHGPMVASELWLSDTSPDLVQLWNILEGRRPIVSFPVKPVSQPRSPAAFAGTSEEISGWLFGGNLSVLTNLLGTTYFPQHLRGAVLFLEDVGENPARLARQFNQWVHLGVLAGVKALILGGLTALGKDIPDHDPRLLQQFRMRSNIPTFSTPAFGHLTPNFPIAYGATGSIKNEQLTWRFADQLIA